jgi:hypothetical protein
MIECNKFRRSLELGLKLASLFVFIAYFYMVIRADTDLSAGRFVLFMDERITFDGVKKIIHPDGFLNFFESVLDGGDQRYGRILWNVMAIFSFIPERVFGESGQIIASRILQSMLILASYILISYGILRNWVFRFLLLLVMLGMPFSDYYMTMPKPEPLQLLFLSIFIYFYITKEGSLTWYWVFLGAAFGTKISIAPVIVCLGMVSLLFLGGNKKLNLNNSGFQIAVIAFLSGLAVSVPILTPSIIILFGIYIIGLLFWGQENIESGTSKLIYLLAGLCITLLLTYKNLKNWATWTFLNSAHGADQADINVTSWIAYISSIWFNSNAVVGLVFYISIIMFICYCVVHVRRLTANGVGDRRLVLPIGIAVAGLCMNIILIFSVKRLWGFYLYTGTMLLLIGVVILLEMSFSYIKIKGSKHNEIVLIFTHHLVVLILFVVSACYWIPQSLSALNQYSLRTSQEAYKLDAASYKSVVNFLKEEIVSENERLRVMFSPKLFPPESNAKYEIVEYWGPFTRWAEENDVIILSVSNTPRGNSIPVDSPEYGAFLTERNGYHEHVVNNQNTCKIQPCFKRVKVLENGGEILARER